MLILFLDLCVVVLSKFRRDMTPPSSGEGLIRASRETEQVYVIKTPLLSAKDSITRQRRVILIIVPWSPFILVETRHQPCLLDQCLHICENPLTLLISALKMGAAYTSETQALLPTSQPCKDSRGLTSTVHYRESLNSLITLISLTFVTITEGRAIAQAVSRRLPIAAARVRAQVSLWDLWWTKWHWGRFSPSNSVSPANCHSTDCSTFMIYHPELIQ
jgi:hypothetical protein